MKRQRHTRRTRDDRGRGGSNAAASRGPPRSASHHESRGEARKDCIDMRATKGSPHRLRSKQALPGP